MALRMTATHDVPLMGEQQFSAYIRVQMISGSKSSMTADVRFMLDVPDGEIIKTASINFTPDLAGGTEAGGTPCHACFLVGRLCSSCSSESMLYGCTVYAGQTVGEFLTN